MTESERPKTFYTSRMAEAAYLSEVKGIPIIDVYLTSNDQFRIVLDVSYPEAKKLLLDWKGSSHFRFDAQIKNLKDILCCDNPPRKDER